LARIFSCCLRFQWQPSACIFRAGSRFYWRFPIKPFYEKGPYTSCADEEVLLTPMPHATAPIFLSRGIFAEGGGVSQAYCC
jgi:hypothetical protein